MQPITSSYLRTNQPPTISNGYKNWWDNAAQNTQRLPLMQAVQAPSYGHPSNPVPPKLGSTIQQLPHVNNQMSLITNLNYLNNTNRGCGCNK